MRWPATSSPEEYTDSYREALETLVQSKADGIPLAEEPEAPKEAEVVDLVAALRAWAAKKRREQAEQAKATVISVRGRDHQRPATGERAGANLRAWISGANQPRSDPETASAGADPIDLPATIGAGSRLGGGRRSTSSCRRIIVTFWGTPRTPPKQMPRTPSTRHWGSAGLGGSRLRRSGRGVLRAADLLAGPWRDTLNAATMLGQGKTVQQAEIDAACELIDFWRFNVAFARQILGEQPVSSPGVWNRIDYRPLDGFVYAITPFNFTAIAGNLPTAPALMGNTVIWKPSPTQQFAAHYVAPATSGWIAAGGDQHAARRRSGGVGGHPSPSRLRWAHFTGSTATFQRLWRMVAENIGNYRSYPRLVGETGGKDFVVAHPSADPDVLRTALIRGAFEYSGQKCSAASRLRCPECLGQD